MKKFNFSALVAIFNKNPVSKDPENNRAAAGGVARHVEGPHPFFDVFPEMYEDHADHPGLQTQRPDDAVHTIYVFLRNLSPDITVDEFLRVMGVPLDLPGSEYRRVADEENSAPLPPTRRLAP